MPISNTKKNSLPTPTIPEYAYIRTEIENLKIGKQDLLVSGTNIKTINGVSILGIGDIAGGGGAQADWNSTSGPSQILHKPTLSTVATTGNYNDLSNLPSIPSIAGLATQAYVDTHISDLIASAPAALDTLNELAAALGNDVNFSTTIINAIAGKQSTLVSGTNIKTVAGTSLLGSGDLAITKSNVGLSLVENTALSTWVGSSNLSTLGTITTGTWNSTLIAGQYGGTGVNNTGKTITLGGNLTTSGAFGLTLTLSAITSVTLPTSGTIVGSADTGTVTNTMLAGSIANAKLLNSSVTIGSTAVALGATVTTFAGLTSITSTTFVGALTGNASTVTNGVYTTDTGTVTNTMLAGSIANDKLASSSVTIGSTAVALGATVTTFAGLTSVTSTTFVGALTGNSSTATKFASTVNIQGVAFDGSAAINPINGTGFVKATGTTLSYDASTYLTANQTITLGGFLSGSGTTSITTTSASKFIVQGTADANLTGAQFLGSLATGFLRNTTSTGVLTVDTTVYQPQINGTGFVKATGTTISYDNSTYLTENQSITLSGHITGTGTTSIATTSASKMILQGTSDATATQAQFLGSLATGIVKNTTSTGVLSIATPGTDYEPPIGNPSISGYILSSTTGGVRSWVANGGGVTKPYVIAMAYSTSMGAF